MKAHFVQDLITFFLDANASPKAKRSPAIIVGLSLSLTQVLLTFLAIRVTPLCPATGRERRTWLFEKTRSPFGFFGRLSKAGHGHGICALMHSVSRKRNLSLCRGHSHFNRFAHCGSTDPTSTGSYLSQPQV